MERSDLWSEQNLEQMCGRELEERWGIELELESEGTSEICLVKELEFWAELESEMDLEQTLEH